MKLMEIVGLLQGANLPSNFVTRSLMNYFPITESMRATASGIIALEIARDPVTYILFFRPEVAQTVVWAGNPEKPVTATEGGSSCIRGTLSQPGRKRSKARRYRGRRARCAPPTNCAS